MRTRIWRPATTLLALLLIGTAYAADGLNCVQQPTFWIVGQQTRIMIQTPADCGKLEVKHPPELVLFDRWPHKPGDTTQRFYFRAQAPLKSGELVFSSGNYTLTLPVRVLSWQEVMTERFEVPLNPPGASTRGGIHWGDTLKLPRLFPIEGDDEHKTALSSITPEELEQQRAGLMKDLRVHADSRIALTEDIGKLFHSLPESTIPRAVYVNNPVYRAKDPDPAKGCPVCGTKVFEGRSAFYPWVLDRENHPLKVQCPECQRWFPSNDFAAGDMTSGEFPDDGWSYFDSKGRPYSFVGYYVLHNYRGGERRAEEFSRYYLATSDRRWARASAVLLFRVAEQYLNLALNINQRERYMRDNMWRGTIPPQGTPPPSSASWFSPGFYLDAVWSVGLDRFYGPAFERILDYFDEQDPELLSFLQDNYHPEMRTMQDVRNFIETGYFRTAAQGVLDYSLSGNGPVEHAMAMRLALFLNSPRSIELVDWAFNNSTNGMRYYLPNNFFVDGAGYESPGYNNAHYGGTLMLADMLERVTELRPQQYAAANFPALTEDPKYKYMFDHNINISLISRTYANVGDDGDLADTDPLPIRAGASLSRHYWINAFKHWPEQVDYARALWDSEANAPTRYLKDPQLRAKVTEIVEREGPYLDLPSQVLDGFGQVILRSGKDDDQRSLWMRYGAMYGHFQHDALTIGYEALKRTFLPEQGYYRGPDHRTEWDMNWAIHYCARIVGASNEPPGEWGLQRRVNAGLQLFGDGGWAQMATAGRRLYNQLEPPELLELTDDLAINRTIGLINLDDQHSYAVSIYRLTGGTDHYWSFHGPRGTAEASGLELTPQNGGTLAGPDVPYGLKWDSDWSKQNFHLLAFPFLRDVQRARPAQPWTVRWDLEKYADVHLRLHSVQPGGAEVALCKGKPPGGGKPYELQWVVQHNKGNEPLATQFVEALEAYEGEPLISQVRRLEVKTADPSAQTPVAFQVVAGSRVDTIIHCQNPDIPVTTSDGITMQGSFAVWSEQDGKLKRVFLIGGTRIAKGDKEYNLPAAAWSGKIASADFKKFEVIVAAQHDTPQALVGRYAHIISAQGNQATHLIVAARSVPAGVELGLELDPRIGEGPVSEVHEDGVTSAVQIKFGGLYYRGKTLCNENHTAMYKLNGVESSRAYINTAAHPDVSKAKLAAEFVDTEGDGSARFTIYDYGPGDTLTVPNLISIDNAGQ